MIVILVLGTVTSRELTRIEFRTRRCASSFDSELSMLSRYLRIKLATRLEVSDGLSNRRSVTEFLTCWWAHSRRTFVSVLRL